MKLIATGSSNFKEIIEGNYFYVDKTLLIKELAENGSAVILFPRPRRFGKTLNLSMLQYFYEKTEQSNQHLFENTAIWQEEKYRNEQGTWPVISITLKDVKLESWDEAYAKLTEIISSEFERHEHILAHKIIDELSRKKFQALLNKSADETAFGSSLQWLSQLLFKIYKKQAIVLIDEYDAPIHAAYLNGYYDEMLNFMRPLLSGVLKDNNFLHRGILTGIMRVAKEGIFSGLNNIIVYSMLEDRFNHAFGFTQEEVDDALTAYNLQAHRDAIKQWYNGYQSGDITVYNPWSVVNCLQERGKLKYYWLNTSDNALVKREIASCSDEVYAALETLLDRQSVAISIEDSITLPDLGLTTTSGLRKKENAVWTLLFYSGYLTYLSYKLDEIRGQFICTLRIPNDEIRTLYKNLITESVSNFSPAKEITQLQSALQDGNALKFATLLQKFVLQSASSRDLPFDECERNIHLFVLGILVLFENLYSVRSNRESGYGIYDIMLIPKDPSYAGWVVEFKKVDLDMSEKIEKIVDVALAQIKSREYATELRAQGVTNIIAVGIAVEGKKLLIKHEKIL